jgi:hypothetical protein
LKRFYALLLVPEYNRFGGGFRKVAKVTPNGEKKPELFNYISYK